MKLYPVFIFILITCLNHVDGSEFNAMEKINTNHNEFAPSVSKDGKFMVFNSKRDKDKYMDIYISYFQNGLWTSPVKFDILNSPYNDETPFINKDGNIIVFSSDRDGSREMKIRGKKSLVSYDLYWSRKIQGFWSVPEPVPGYINTGDHERAPSLSADNLTLYFSRWAAGQMKNAAIMMSKFDRRNFMEPVMMSKEINSGNMELALIPDQEETGYYFSSAREGGLGGWDIYYISSHNGQLGMPINLGDKINSKYGEAFFSILNGRIYYCSDRIREGKDYDILQTFLPGEKQIYFRITNKQLEPVIANVELQNIFANKIPEIIKRKSDDSGLFSTLIQDGLESIDLFIEEKGYLPYYRKIDKSELLNPEFELVLTPVQANTSFSIEAIYFDYEKAELKEESFTYLKRLANYLQINSEINLRIIGHTDLHGPDDYNLELSKQRALSVKKFLVDNGISADRFEISGMGKSSPIINEINDHADQINRRTEFKVIQKHE